MSMLPLISVLMPCYNGAPFVKEAVESVLGQTWSNIELIVVDDGSSDESYAALCGIRDVRMKVVRQSNQGQSAAANYAFSLSSGEFIKFLDADDIISASCLETQVSMIYRRSDVVAMGEWARFYDGDKEKARFEHLPMYRTAMPVEWLASEWLRGEVMMQCALWLIPRAVLDRSGLWDVELSLINDFEFFTRVLLSASEIVYTPGARLYYRSGSGSSLSASRSRRAAESACLSLLLGTQRLLDAEGSDRARNASANILQTFEYTFYPEFPDLRRLVRRRVAALGGSDLAPVGPPGFQKLRRFTGWRIARHVQLAAERFGLSGAKRSAVKRPLTMEGGGSDDRRHVR